MPRHGYSVLSGPARVGTVTSGAPSPTLGVPIAMAYIDTFYSGAVTHIDTVTDNNTGAPLGIDIRGKTEPAELTELPFYDRRK